MATRLVRKGSATYGQGEPNVSPSLPVALFASAELRCEATFGSKSPGASSSYRAPVPSPEVLSLVSDFVEMNKYVTKLIDKEINK